MNEKYRFENNHELFKDDIPENVKELKTVYDRPYAVYTASVLFVAIFLFLLPERRLITVIVMLVLTLALFIRKNYPVVGIYEDFLIVYSRNLDGESEKLLIRNQDLISWDAMSQAGKLQLYYKDNQDVRSVIITTDNLTGVTTAFSIYYKDLYGGRLRSVQFAGIIKKLNVRKKVFSVFRKIFNRK